MMSSAQTAHRTSGHPRQGQEHPPPSRKSSPWLPRLPETSREFLDRLVRLGLVSSDAIGPFLEERADRLAEYRGEVEIGQALVESDLLTRFQLDRVLSGHAHGLVLGNYRVLDQIGSGGMGLVFLGEHCLMRRRVAIKVLPVDDDCHPSLRHRFYAEMRVLAELNHPNIVQAFDAGELAGGSASFPPLTYLVMELVDGGDLERHVEKNGPLNIARACDFIRQAAQGLQAAHDLHIVHRDIKPSNLLLTTRGQIKLVDFGLAHQFSSQLTDPRALLGSVDFMAPEQSHDPSGVGPEADVYGLAATLFWLLTGEAPYPYMPSIGAALRSLQSGEPRRLGDLRPDVPPELDDLVERMLSRDPASRPRPPAIITALGPLAVEGPPGGPEPSSQPTNSVVRARPSAGEAWRARLLIVEAAGGVRGMIRQVAEGLGCLCREAGDGPATLDLARREAIDLAIVDLEFPTLPGLEICRDLRRTFSSSNFKLLATTRTHEQGEAALSLPDGPDDYEIRPLDPGRLRTRLDRLLRMKEEQDRGRARAEQLQRQARQLELSLEASRSDVREAHDAILFTMAKMAESRDGETPGHLRRLQRYVVTLARRAARERPWQGLVDDRFLARLERCVVLHDIGKIGLPDDILLKPASLTESERSLVKTHPLIGDRILESLAKEYGTSLDFLVTARDIVRHHHERWDGTGYPDGLAGQEIPPAARLTAVADVYDALRRERLHKPALSHQRAVAVLTDSPGQFDPTLMEAFPGCHEAFEQIYREVGY